MDTEVVIDIIREGLWIIIKCASPLLLISMIIGLVISIFQTVTSIQEQTLTFVPKIIGMFLTLILIGGWMIDTIVEFTIQLFQRFATYVR